MEEFKNYKLVCLDVDGTLVNDDKDVTRFTREQILRIRRDFRTEFVLVSSRMPRSLLGLMQDLQLNGPVVAYNGALILRNASFTSDADILQSVNLPSNTLSAVNAALHGLGEKVHIGVFSNNAWKVKEVDYWALREARGTKIWPDVDEGIFSGQSTIPLDRLHKVMIRAHAATLDEIEIVLATTLPEGCEIFRSNDTFVEISPTTALKSPAVSVIQELLSVAPAETIAFGEIKTTWKRLNR